MTIELARYKHASDIFSVETISGSPDYRCSIGREDAPHVFNVEAERAEQIQRHLLTLESEGWTREK